VMKWTSHDHLSSYGGRLVGWLTDVSHENSSSLKVAQNQQFLDAMKSGSMKVERAVSLETNLADQEIGVTEGRKVVSWPVEVNCYTLRDIELN
jgi:hypothetical protein